MNGKLIMYFLLVGMFILLQTFDKGAFNNVWTIMIYACMIWMSTEFKFSSTKLNTILGAIGNILIVVAFIELVRVILRF